jgi:hypothetical protein
LLVDASASLYVTPSWLDTEFDDREGEKVRDVAIGWTKWTEKGQLIENIKSISGVDVADFKEVKPSAAVLKNLSDAESVEVDRDQFIVLQDGGAAAGRVRGEFANALDERTIIHEVPSKMPIIPTTTTAGLTKHLLMDPKVLVASPSDLGEGHELTKICALIAIYKSESGDLPGLRTKINAPTSVKTDLGFYEALHKHYYNTKKIEYTEPSTHAALYADYGYTLIFAGNTPFADLPNKLRQPLDTGKKYILDIKGHTVFATMRKKITPGTALVGLASSYFNFQSDRGRNFNLAETDFNVENIYEK